MIKIENGEVEIAGEDISQIMSEASMLIMQVARVVSESIPNEKATPDFIIVDLFKSLRYAALSEQGLDEEEILKILNPQETEKQKKIKV